jgi:peptidoglycan/xylan/chitin deacetylase (PgdA/CDA1 family)
MTRSLRSLGRDLAGRALFASGVTLPERRGRGRLTIATFHRVLPEAQRREYPLPGLVVTPEELDWCVGFFRRHWECGPLREAFARWREGTATPRPLLALTFDDGQLDNFLHARPVLGRHGVCGTFFASVSHVESGEPIWHDRLGFALADLFARDRAGARGLLDRLGHPAPAAASVREAVAQAKRLPALALLALVDRVEAAADGPARPTWDGIMSWEQLAQLAREGHEVASHAMTHPILPACDIGQIEHEVAESKRVLECHLDREVSSFCYPNGDCDARTIVAVREAGYRVAVTARWGPNPPDADPFELRRCEITGEHARDRHGVPCEARLAWRMSGFYPGLR